MANFIPILKKKNNNNETSWNRYPYDIMGEKKIDEFNAGMDIICLTSDNEGTPVSLIEAQASGVPVISTNVGGVSNIVKNNETGFIVQKHDLKNYVSKLLTLIEEKELRTSFHLKVGILLKEIPL